jgi:hypothetical protein
VTGTDEAGTAAAASHFNEDDLRDHYALATDAAGEPRSVPAPDDAPEAPAAEDCP